MQSKTISAALGACLVLAGAYHYVSQLDAPLAETETSLHPHELQPVHAPASDADYKTDVSSPTVTEDTHYQGDSREEMAPNIHQLSTAVYRQQSIFGALPDRLQATDIPPLYTHADGSLLMDRSAQRFMEFFLGAAREESTQTAIGRMQELFSLMLDEPAYSQAHALLNNYMDYRAQLDNFVSRNDIMQAGTHRTEVLRETLDRRRMLRRETLGHEVASAMFGDSERYEDYAVKLLALQDDTTLSESEKQTRAVQIESDLPEHLRQRIVRERRVRETEAAIAKLKTQPGTEAEIYALRRETYGEPYAKHWAYMEEQSPEWQNRVVHFEQAKQAVLDSVMLSDAQQREQIRQLRDQYFSPDELAKLAWQSLQ